MEKAALPLPAAPGGPQAGGEWVTPLGGEEGRQEGKRQGGQPEGWLAALGKKVSPPLPFLPPHPAPRDPCGLPHGQGALFYLRSSLIISRFYFQKKTGNEKRENIIQ